MVDFQVYKPSEIDRFIYAPLNNGMPLISMKSTTLYFWCSHRLYTSTIKCSCYGPIHYGEETPDEQVVLKNTPRDEKVLKNIGAFLCSVFPRKGRYLFIKIARCLRKTYGQR